MLNQEILSILRDIYSKDEQVFTNPKKFAAVLKDLTKNDCNYTATIRWLVISLSDFNAFSLIENDFKNRQDFARHKLINSLVREGAAQAVAEEVIGYWAVLAGFPPEDEIDMREYSISEIEQMANDGNPSAQCAMGDFFNVGNENTDFHKAFAWYEKSAHQGYARAQWNIGNFYVVGQVVSQDFQKSIYWLEKSANQGYLDAMLHAGQVSVVIDDYEKAVQWIEMAHEKGHPEAEMHLKAAKMLQKQFNRNK
jgi:hypothetical protein